ncbi:hypothetical protein [Runella slithyformis]|nr:hypothetical protein [Runella slithyformis]
MPTPSQIAKFRYGTKETLQSATGFLHFCSAEMNELLKSTEKIPGHVPAIYCLLICNKILPPAPSGTESPQRNIYFRYDLQNNIFFMEPTGNTDESGPIIAFEYEVLFFPQAMFISVKDDYIALENWLKNGQAPTLNIRSAHNNLANFINDNDGDTFILTQGHTRKLSK